MGNEELNCKEIMTVILLRKQDRKSLVELAKAKQAELPSDSPFRIRVRGAPGETKIVKIDPNGKWTALETSLLI